MMTAPASCGDAKTTTHGDGGGRRPMRFRGELRGLRGKTNEAVKRPTTIANKRDSPPHTDTTRTTRLNPHTNHARSTPPAEKKLRSALRKEEKPRAGCAVEKRNRVRERIRWAVGLWGRRKKNGPRVREKEKKWE
ncbi:hypothetical protein Droror1_Dr00000188 [Drosera rotundifolia]